VHTYGRVAVARPPWKVQRAITDPDEIHIRPRNDRRWHPPAADCWCGPKAENLGCGAGHRLVTHQAADGRTPLGRVDGVEEGPVDRWAGWSGRDC